MPPTCPWHLVASPPFGLAHGYAARAPKTTACPATVSVSDAAKRFAEPVQHVEGRRAPACLDTGDGRLGGTHPTGQLCLGYAHLGPQRVNQLGQVRGKAGLGVGPGILDPVSFAELRLAALTECLESPSSSPGLLPRLHGTARTLDFASLVLALLDECGQCDDVSLTVEIVGQSLRYRTNDMSGRDQVANSAPVGIEAVSNDLT